MAISRSKSGTKRRIAQYEHTDKQRVNNPPVGLVTPQTDPPTSQKRTYQYDPHLDPQLVWAGIADQHVRDFETSAAEPLNTPRSSMRLSLREPRPVRLRGRARWTAACR